MKLLNETTIDTDFNKQLVKIQDATRKLEQLAGSMTKNDMAVVQSQIDSVEYVAKDLKDLAARLASAKKK